MADFFQEDMKKISRCWDERAAGFDEEHDTEDLDLWREALDTLLHLPKGSKILDVGTGTGFLARLTSGLGYEAAGADVSEGMLSIARSSSLREDKKIDYVLFDGRSLPFQDETFDAVVNSRLLWTLSDPKGAFEEWKRVLKTGGRVLSFMRPAKDLEAPTLWCYDEDLEGRLSLKYAPVPEIMELFRGAGFRNVWVAYLPVEMSHADLPPWYCIVCDK
ncbi:MAG: methyltransferase domain-containing protein [Eubacteriales bacterium]|nr:methyltransferase domain-containing protein [Eubacteriales bacterium]